MNAFAQFERCAINQYRALPEHQKRWHKATLEFGTPIGRVTGPTQILWWVTDNHGHPMALLSIKGDDWIGV